MNRPSKDLRVRNFSRADAWQAFLKLSEAMTACEECMQERDAEDVAKPMAKAGRRTHVRELWRLTPFNDRW